MSAWPESQILYDEAHRDFKNDILWEIEEEIKKLDDQDAEGHIWWNKFKEFIKSK